MKALGFILLGIQIMAYISGNSNMGNESVAYMLGYNLWGVIGVILLVIAYNKENKTPGPTEKKESEPIEDKKD